MIKGVCVRGNYIRFWEFEKVFWRSRYLFRVLKYKAGVVRLEEKERCFKGKKGFEMKVRNEKNLGGINNRENFSVVWVESSIRGGG